jgi:hypothetical protein
MLTCKAGGNTLGWIDCGAAALAAAAVFVGPIESEGTIGAGTVSSAPAPVCDFV